MSLFKQINCSYLLLFCFGLLMFSTNGIAQSKSELEKRKKELNKEISLINGMLKETEKNKALTYDQLLKLKSKINARANLISTIHSEIKLINKKIADNEAIITAMEKDLAQLKQEYAKMIYYAFIHKSQKDKIMFVMAAESFNQAYKRLKYIQQYTTYRQSQAELIVKTQQDLQKRNNDLKNSKQEKAALLSLEEQEKSKLAVEKSQQETVISKLQGKEQDLKDKLRKKEEAAAKLQKAIQRIIEEEIRKAKEAAKKAGNTTKGFPMTPEAQMLSNSFEANKGKLPWPVIEGVITAKFGQHNHPVLPGIVVNNNGIDISTSGGAKARAIFDGEVSSVAIIPGEGKVVMIRHGEYLSVYSYMSEVFVQKGDKISTKQELGILINDTGNSGTSVHIEIWKGMTKLNPEYWIYRK
ncbi:MAG: peptidase M23 [Flavobacteriales bacterium]|nr:peptidoglycan DD-metalloendopeptidase family protein [Flavobacteriales bacterium]MBQ20409.1 peptidase M23 [Flavobacteriales bacterium]